MPDFFFRILSDQIADRNSLYDEVSKLISALKQAQEKAKNLGLEEEFCNEIAQVMSNQKGDIWIQFVKGERAKPQPYKHEWEEEAGTNE